MFFCDKLFGWEQLFTGCTGVLCQPAELNAAGTRPSLHYSTSQLFKVASLK